MNVLVIGPFPEPITGNSLANQIIFENLDKYYPNINIDRINTSYSSLKEDIGSFSLKKVIHYIKQYVGLVKVFRCDKLYYTSGQTFFGVLKYFPYLLCAKLLSKEIIVHIHGNYLHKEYECLNRLKRYFFRKTLMLCDKGIVLSKTLRKNLTPFLRENRIFELNNFVEDFLFQARGGAQDFDKLKIIYLSNLMTEKGVFDLLDALDILTKNNIEFEAKIAGGIDTSVEEEIRKKLNNSPVCVDYLGLVYAEEKKDMLEWGNVFVFPTYYAMEGQPISIFEAMATSNIILTTKHAGIPDVFEEEVNGFYIEKRSPNSIAIKLQMISENMGRCIEISDRNMEEASEKYRVESFIDNLYNILNE